MYEYQFRLLDKDGVIISVLDRFARAEFTREPSTVTTCTVVIAKGDTKVPSVNLMRYLAVYRKDSTTEVFTELSRFIIAERNVAASEITITALSEESLLDRTVCPEDYAPALTLLNRDLAHVVKQSLKGWVSLYANHASHYELTSATGRRLYKRNVSTELIQNRITLQKNEEDKFPFRGVMQLRFLKSEVPNFSHWERVRWLSDYGEDAGIRTFIQIRYGNGTSMSSWTNDIRGVLTDTVGYPTSGFDALGVGADTADVIDVQVVLESDHDDITPVFTGVELIARTNTVITTAPNFPSVAGVNVGQITASNTSSYDIIKTACENAGWQFTVNQGKISIAKRIGEDKTNSVLLTTGEAP